MHTLTVLLGAHPGHLVQKGLMTRRAEWERGKREPEEREGEKEREERPVLYPLQRAK